MKVSVPEVEVSVVAAAEVKRRFPDVSVERVRFAPVTERLLAYAASMENALVVSMVVVEESMSIV